MDSNKIKNSRYSCQGSVKGVLTPTKVDRLEDQLP